ncbi:glycosyltransferase family 2 protein [bacterium]|nr:glycosyltransferase family 2 protein [bacterium]
MIKDQNVEDSQPSIKLSVLIVSYNSGKTIQVCIESLMEGISSISSEIIIIDNNSTDDTANILKAMETQHDQLSLVLNNTNRGFAAGNNQALDQAHGDYILVLNPDTITQAGVVSGLISELEKNERMGMVAPQLQFPDGRIQKTCRRLPTHMDVIYHSLGLTQLFPASSRFNAWKMGDFDHRSTRQVDQPAGAALMIKGSLFRELKGFDQNFPMFFNDVDLCKRIKDAGYEIWYMPDYHITHVGGASVKQVKLKMVLSSHVSFFRYFEKHFTRLHHQPLNFLVGALLYLSLIPRIFVIALFRGRQSSSRDTL